MHYNEHGLLLLASPGHAAVDALEALLVHLWGIEWVSWVDYSFNDIKDTEEEALELETNEGSFYMDLLYKLELQKE